MPEFQELVEELSERESRLQAWRPLFDGGDGARRALTDGLSHELISVRRYSAAILDHHDLDDDATSALLAAMRDPNRRVRANAVHALGCERCKPDPDKCVDATPAVIDALLHDPSARVRCA